MDRVKVIYLYGSGHSGTTLAALLLGSHPRIECVGELKQFEKSLARDRRCNCGEPIAGCSYWQEVFSRAGNDIYGKPPEINKEQKGFGRDNSRFIRSMLDTSRKDVFCDSSKTKNRLLGYLASEEFDVSVLHIVRDGRAVARSNAKKTRSFWRYACRWKKTNGRDLDRLFQKGLRKKRYFCIRYEDLALDPATTLKKFLNEMDLEFDECQLTNWRTANHHIGGNRMGRESSPEIRFDRAYIDSLTAAQWLGASAIQAPILRRFGYPLLRSAASHAFSANHPSNKNPPCG